MVTLDEDSTLPRTAVAPPTEVTAVTNLLPRVTTMTVAVVIGLALLRGQHGSKAWDKAMFAVPVALAALLCVYFLVRAPRRSTSAIASVLATCGLLVGIARIERQGEFTYVGGIAYRLPQLFWEGFGFEVAVAALLLALALWFGLERIDSSRRLQHVLTAAVAIVALVDLPSLIRTVSNFAEPSNNVYMLNEVLAPAAGRVPDGNFVPQYVTLYGWVLVPFRHLLSAYDLAALAMIFMSCLGVLSVVLAVTIAARSMSRPSVWLAAAIVIPLTCVTARHDATPHFVSSIGSYMQELPIRMFPTMLYSFLGLEALTRLRSTRGRVWHLPALGVLAGLIVWNSQDFGIVVTIAYFAVLIVAAPRGRAVRSALSWGGGFAAGLVVYPLLSSLTGAPVRLSNFGLFSRAFANGYASSPIQVPGPVLVVLPVLLAATSVGWCLLWRHRSRESTAPSAQDRTILTLALVGTWATGGFVYYLDRSYASGQLQVLLMPCGVCLAALASLGLEARRQLPRIGERPASLSLRQYLSLLPVALLVSLGMASMLQGPGPATVAKGFRNTPADVAFSSSVVPAATLASAEAYVNSQG